MKRIPAMASLFCLAATAFAQGYPIKPVRLVVRAVKEAGIPPQD